MWCLEFSVEMTNQHQVVSLNRLQNLGFSQVLFPGYKANRDTEALNVPSFQPCTVLNVFAFGMSDWCLCHAFVFQMVAASSLCMSLFVLARRRRPKFQSASPRLHGL